MIICCDTNILISAFIFPGGFPDKIVQAIQMKRFENVTSLELLNEFKKVLITKFKLSLERANDYVMFVSNMSTIVHPTEKLSIIREDVADNRVLECAFTGHASYIITGDKLLLNYNKKMKQLEIVTPKVFSEYFGII